MAQEEISPDTQAYGGWSRALSWQWMSRERTGLEEGKVIIKGARRPYIVGEQGSVRYMSMPMMLDTSIDNMMLFIHRIPVHTGRHVHQGGFALFVVEGKGYTVVDGVRHGWEAGDLILLPIKPGGAEHQHFNLDPQNPSRWLALQCRPLLEMMGRRVEQRELSPLWRKEHGDQVRHVEARLESKK